MDVVLWALVGASFVVVALFMYNVSVPRFAVLDRLAVMRSEAARSWQLSDGDAAKGRVLVVGRSGNGRSRNETVLRGAGYKTRSCPGPGGPPRTFPYGGCLLLDEGQCPLASGADAIVFGLDLRRRVARRLLRAYHLTGPNTRLCVGGDVPGPRRYANLLRDCRVTRVESETELISAVERTLAHSH